MHITDHLIDPICLFQSNNPQDLLNDVVYFARLQSNVVSFDLKGLLP
jgi:hypothetical protein